MKKVIYLAGGCFWGIEHLMKSIPGVVSTACGYANGKEGAEATYQAVCAGRTGFRETVKVEYETEEVSLERLLFAFFAVIDPTMFERQGFDFGSQYQTGVYWTDEESRRIVERIGEIERAEYRQFFVELEPLRNFCPAEEYHQHYLDKNPGGYCHVSPLKIQNLSALHIEAADYIGSAKRIYSEKTAPPVLLFEEE